MFHSGSTTASRPQGHSRPAHQGGGEIRPLPRPFLLLLASALVIGSTIVDAGAAEPSGISLDQVGYLMSASATEPAPSDFQALRERILEVAVLEGPDAARELLERFRGELDEDQVIELRGDMAAQWIRQAEPMEDIPRRQATTDQALEELEGLLEELPADGPATRRARFDYILALRQRERMEETVAEYQALIDEGIEPPSWVIQSAADAHLYLRQPEQATTLYRQVLAGDPTAFQARIALFYALVESERFNEALEEIENLAAEHKGQPSGVEAELVAAMGHAFANRLDKAQQRLEALAEAHPEHLRIRQELSTVYRWRGWPNRALEIIDPVVAEAPEAVGPRLARAAALAELQRPAQAEAMLESLLADHPENLHVQRQYRDWQNRDRWHLSSRAEYGDSDGFQALGSRDRSLNNRLTAPVIGHHFQPWITSRYADARFPEGEADYDRIGVGASWRDRRHHGYLEIHRNRTGTAETGWTAGYDWHSGDHWSFATRYESFTQDVPLRARGQGLDGDKGQVAVRWQAHESLGIRGSLTRVGISDGNTRWSALLGSDHRLISQAHHITSGSLDLYGSRASQEGGPYFNPSRDASLGYTVQHDWLTWRHYTNSLTQRFLAGAGAYWQDGAGTGAIGDLGYRHRWALGNDFHLDYGVGLSTRVYDGDREQRLHGSIGLEVRF